MTILKKLSITQKFFLTTNDWNVIGTKNFEGLNLTSFNINPHYIDPHDKSIFSAESKDDRIFEHFVFHEHPVVALEEKTLLKIDGDEIRVFGEGKVKIFSKNSQPKIFFAGANLKI